MLQYQEGNERALQLTAAKIANQVEPSSQSLQGCNPGLYRRDKYIFFFTLETNTVLWICLPNRALKKGSVNPTFPCRSFLAIFALFIYITWFGAGACFSKDPVNNPARKSIFSSSVSKTGELYTPETSYMKRTSVHIKNMRIKQLCNRKVRDFAMSLPARKVSGAFEKLDPAQGILPGLQTYLLLNS